MTGRPNILYFMTDQHRADWLGCAGHPVVRTPHIDGLAARGTRFANFYVTSPVCMPNRGAIFTGRYPSVNGLRHNGLPLPETAHTFVDLLRDAGYHTASIGKSHLQPFTDRPVRPEGRSAAVNARIPEATRPSGAAYESEHPATYEGESPFDVPAPYYGFDHVKLVTGHGDECGGHYLQWLRRQTNEWASLRDRASQLPHACENPQAFRTPIPEDLYPTAYIQGEAKAYIEERSAAQAPFFAFVSFPDPHHPFTPPGKYWDMFAPEAFEVDLPFEAHQNPPDQLLAWKALMDQGVAPANPQQAFMAPKRQIQEAMALSAGMIAMIDDAIGDILATLRACGAAEDTIVVFNADHGDYMGAFSLLLKGPFPHASVNRVPFIWADPQAAGARVADGLAASVDIAPTILERCGVLPYYGMQGRSFLAQIEGGESARDAVLIEHEENKLYPGFPEIPNIRNLITGTHRLSVYKGMQSGELYDLARDPDETRNLWDESGCAQVRSDLLFRLGQAMLDAIEPGPRPARYA